MPLVTDYMQVKETYQEAAERGIAIPSFCAEDCETVEAILAATWELGKEIGVSSLPITVAWTPHYPTRSQLTLVSASGDALLGLNLMLSDLHTYMGESSPYRHLRVLPHLDHAFPWLDSDFLELSVGKLASVMCDASEKPFAENIRLTAAYVEKGRGKIVVEGAVDEIYEAGGTGEKNEPTSVEQAVRFMRETGVDIIVPNVGTEHRSVGKTAHYQHQRACEISTAVGKKMCLHGTSSLNMDALGQLPADGFVKINIFTTLVVHGGQAVARQVLANLGNLFTEEQLRELVQAGVLGEKVLAADYGATVLPIKPKLKVVANAPRRDAWFAAVKGRCREFLEALNYRRYPA
jgi:fructose/tagatose bisphosphate aldolase